MSKFGGISVPVALLSLIVLSTACDTFPRVEVNCQVGQRSSDPVGNNPMQHCEFHNYGKAPASGCVVVKVLPTEASPDNAPSELTSKPVCYTQLMPKAEAIKTSCTPNDPESTCPEFYECNGDTGKCQPKAEKLAFSGGSRPDGSDAVRAACLKREGNRSHFTCRVVIEEERE